MSINPITWAIGGIGVLMAAPLFISGAQDLSNRAAPYMVAQPLIIDPVARTVTQEHIVFGVHNMPAGWAARITAPDGRVLCQGKSKPNGASYHNRKPSTFGYSDWAGDDCPDHIPPGSTFWAEWEYSVDGQRFRTSAQKVVE